MVSLTTNELRELLPYLSEHERAELDSLLADKSPWQPLPGPQTLASQSPANIIGYGGQAGGGKTDLALGLAFTEHRRSIIFRREFTDLKAVIQRGDEIQAGRCQFVHSPKRAWETPDGRFIEIGACKLEGDKFTYQGNPHDLYAFDEAAEFSESIFRFVTGWLRTTDPHQRTRILLTFNPPMTAEGEWIIQFFGAWLDRQHPNPAKPGELRWYVHLDDKDVEVPDSTPVEHQGKTYQPKSRTFFPARLEDNPYLMATDYGSQLDMLPEPLRSKLKYGDFNATAADDPWQAIPTAWVQLAQKRHREGSKPDVVMRSCGVDVARGGQDNTVIQRLYGTWFDEPLVYPGASVPSGKDTALHVVQAVPQVDTPIMIDAVGYGASAYDYLRDLGNIRVTPVNNSSASNAKDKSGRYCFTNVRAESYWKLREALDPESGEDVALPGDRRVLVDLCAPRFKIVGGKIALESKEDIIKRTGHSPDHGDAIVLTWYGAYRGGPLILFGDDA